jgi:hypothetical protein
MTIAEAEKLGYQVIKASDFEVGLIKGQMGLKTWWSQDFHGVLPGLDHPLIQEAIRINEEHQAFFK